MKQEIVLKLDMHSEKCRKKAMEIAAGTDGVISIAATSAERNQLVVVGVGIDSATLTMSLRKKVGDTNIISIKKMDEDDGDDEEDNEEENNRGSYSGYTYYAPYSAPPPPGYAVVPYGAPQFTNSWFNL